MKNTYTERISVDLVTTIVDNESTSCGTGSVRIPVVQQLSDPSCDLKPRGRHLYVRADRYVLEAC